MFAIRHVRLAVVMVCLMASVTFGQFAADFEAPDYNGSAAGTLLTDIVNGGAAAQQGWYCPSGEDYHVYTYADNPFGMTAVNPTGGDQFASGQTAVQDTPYATRPLPRVCPFATASISTSSCFRIRRWPPLATLAVSRFSLRARISSRCFTGWEGNRL